MSFWTDFKYLQGQPPPQMTTTDLAAFVRAVRATDILAPKQSHAVVNVAFGDAIDQDDVPAEEWVDSGSGMLHCESIDFDIEERVPWDAIPPLLESRDGTVYRALIELGYLTHDVCEALSRQPDERNQIGLYPGSVFLQLGPVVVGDLGTDFLAQVGWIAVGIGGNGYLWPWTLREWVARATSQPLVQALMDVCETMWPAQKRTPTDEMKAHRQELGTLFPYDLDAELAWMWSVSKTG